MTPETIILAIWVLGDAAGVLYLWRRLQRLQQQTQERAARTSDGLERLWSSVLRSALETSRRINDLSEQQSTNQAELVALLQARGDQLRERLDVLLDHRAEALERETNLCIGNLRDDLARRLETATRDSEGHLTEQMAALHDEVTRLRYVKPDHVHTFAFRSYEETDGNRVQVYRCLECGLAERWVQSPETGAAT